MQLITDNFRKEMALRVAKVQHLMQKQNIDGLLISSNANLYYITGRVFRGYVYLSLDHAPIVFVIRPVGLEGDNVIYIRKPEMIINELRNKGIETINNLALEESSSSYSEIVRLRNAMRFENTVNGSTLLAEARMIKTDFEVEKMREDGLKQAKSYMQISSVFKQGMTDTDLQIEIERILRKNGCLGFYRTSGPLMETNLGTVLTGENADNPTPYDFAVGGGGIDTSLPTGAAGLSICSTNTVSVDACGNFNGYQTDMTRVWAPNPETLPEIAKKAHNCSLKILDDFQQNCKPGHQVAEMYNRAMQIVTEANLEEYFMGHTQKAPFIGHGVGIELNELPVITPRSKHLLEPGMTIAIEPKFVIPGVGPVGVENTYVVTSSGLECITKMEMQIMQL